MIYTEFRSNSPLFTKLTYVLHVSYRASLLKIYEYPATCLTADCSSDGQKDVISTSCVPFLLRETHTVLHINNKWNVKRWSQWHKGKITALNAYRDLLSARNQFDRVLSQYTRAVRKVSVHFEYLENWSHGLDVTWQPVTGDLIVHPWTVTVRWG